MYSGKHMYHVPQHFKKSEFMSLTLLTINSDFISKRFNTLVFVIDVTCVFREVETE
jgi:hypothetical protein